MEAPSGGKLDVEYVEISVTCLRTGGYILRTKQLYFYNVAIREPIIPTNQRMVVVQLIGEKGQAAAQVFQGAGHLVHYGRERGYREGGGITLQ